MCVYVSCCYSVPYELRIQTSFDVSLSSVCMCCQCCVRVRVCVCVLTKEITETFIDCAISVCVMVCVRVYSMCVFNGGKHTGKLIDW